MFLFFIPLYFMIYFNWLLPLDAIRFLTFQVKNMRKSKPPSGPLGLKDNEKKKIQIKNPDEEKRSSGFFFFLLVLHVLCAPLLSPRGAR